MIGAFKDLYAKILECRLVVTYHFYYPIEGECDLDINPIAGADNGLHGRLVVLEQCTVQPLYRGPSSGLYCFAISCLQQT